MTQLGEAWVIEVEGGHYFLTAGDGPERIAPIFLGKLPRNPMYPRRPAVIASQHYPLILSVDGVIVRAWPAHPTRDDPPKTYRHPYWTHRVVAIEDAPVWMFAARGRTASPGGPASADHTVADVEALARSWLAAGGG
jgi:hypothetical protein